MTAWTPALTNPESGMACTILVAWHLRGRGWGGSSRLSLWLSEATVARHAGIALERVSILQVSLPSVCPRSQLALVHQQQLV